MSERVSYQRQADIFDPNEHVGANVTFVGCGGIGSFSALAVAKLGVNVTLIDYDKCEPHNVPNQMLSTPSAGDSGEVHKVKDVADTIRQYADVRCRPIVGKITEAGLEHDGTTEPWRPDGLIVSGLDSMVSRKAVWSNIKHKPMVERYIDARLAGQLIVIYSVDPTDPNECDRYEATLHTDEEAEPLPCTERGVIDVGFQVGAQIARKVRHWFNDEQMAQVTLVNQRTLETQEGEYLL